MQNAISETKSLSSSDPAGEVEEISAKEGALHPIIPWLDEQIKVLLLEIQGRDFWKKINDPSADPRIIKMLMKELYLEIVGYQPHVIEAAIAAIAQMPRSMEPRMVRSMLFHQADEFDHGEMALRDYIGLGGSEVEARKLPMSPASFAAAGSWWMIAHLRKPFMYLGALYLFEGLTPIVTGAVKSNLMKKGLDQSSLEYIEFHSTEDIKHAKLVKHLISQVATTYPESVQDIKYGYECFRFVYPIPVWQCAYERVLMQLRG
jgi:pyrroloquinoline quinone (PQQ) biosynthesis protein C